MKVIRICSIVLARFFLSAIFLISALINMLHWQETEHFLLTILSEWQNYTSFSEPLSHFFGALTPWTSLLLLGGTLLELGGGALLLLGIREKLGAALLLLFLIPTTILMHQFWFTEDGGKDVQAISFLKNMAIIGGLIMVALHGAKASGRDENSSPFT